MFTREWIYSKNVHCCSTWLITKTGSFVLGVYLGLRDAGVPVQLTVVSVGPAIAATHPVLCNITLLQRQRRLITNVTCRSAAALIEMSYTACKPSIQYFSTYITCACRFLVLWWFIFMCKNRLFSIVTSPVNSDRPVLLGRWKHTLDLRRRKFWRTLTDPDTEKENPLWFCRIYSVNNQGNWKACCE